MPDPTPANSPDPSALPPSAKRQPNRHLGLKRILGWGAKCITGAAVVVGLVLGSIQLWETTHPANHATPVKETSVPLTLAETPAIGDASSTLGFGDSVGGRPTFPDQGYISTVATPTFDSFTDMPYGVGDERQFMRVSTFAPGATPAPVDFLDHNYPKRNVQVESKRKVVVRIYIHNNADEQGSDCALLTGESIAHNVRVRVVESGGIGTERILRAWVSAANSDPLWITDAVVVRVPKGQRLSFDAQESYTYEKLPPEHLATVDQSIFESAGMQVGQNGDVGSCYENIVLVNIAYQVESSSE